VLKIGDFAQIGQLIATEEARLQRFTARLGQLAALERDDSRHDMVLKRSEPLSPLVQLCYELDPDTDELDLVVGTTVSGSPQDDLAWVRECVPAGELLACVIYRGDYPQTGSAYATLGRWLLASGYEAAGPCREVYHRSPVYTTNPAEYVTEIQYPVTPAQSESASPQSER
jgi:hypothetical protein